MEILLKIFCILTVLSLPKISALNANASTVCSESCMQINPYNSDTAPPVRHCARLTPDNKCECDWEKILTPEGECRCRNPLHIPDPETGLCRCDPERVDGCETGAIQCPEDSIVEEGNCVCLECKENRCEDGMKAVVMVAGEDKPGHCCDIYKCIDSTRDCLHNGDTFSHGSTWLTNITCQKCLCKDGVVVCDLTKNCTSKNETKNCFEIVENVPKAYIHGESWMRDTCTSCLCENGTPKCLSHFCEDSPSVVTFPSSECAPLENCRKSCVFGYKLNSKGCATCKCRIPEDRSLQEKMKKFNCTLENCDLVKLLTSNATQFNNSVELHRATDGQFTITLLSIVIAVLAVILVLFACYHLYFQRKSKNTGSVDMINVETVNTRKNEYSKMSKFPEDNSNYNLLGNRH